MWTEIEIKEWVLILNFEIDEKEINDYANQRMKQLVDQKVREMLKEIEWYHTVDHIIHDVVKESITSDVIQRIITQMNKESLIQQISKNIAENLVEKMVGE